ncbi:hypothetical protein DWW54_03935 [Clostridium sp. AF15-6B]|nr:hypothetical protein DWW62_07070 [Clostridium sp. AF16-25]RGH06063.1 hypothetical protein DWW48_02555 [Clostridium sp. AF15-49]RGH10368.1 hypothetical protein DWW54_03935 [Clostridium sp. AF15-6B]RHQ73245.1 hypothetical protein DWY08_04070 [Clostridium sp. AF23-8]RHS89560.1 hypothetical protein DW920_02820 [Clostridium sp. AM42-36]HCS97057.1 hypothetical protein [Lachnospiraceae bacterium]
MCYTACTFGAKTQAECLRFCYGDEENARIYVVHLTTANQSTMRRAHRVFVLCTGINSKETGRCENYITML